MFSFEYCKIFKNTYFEEHLWTAASANFPFGNLCNKTYFHIILNMVQGVKEKLFSIFFKFWLYAEDL